MNKRRTLQEQLDHTFLKEYQAAAFNELSILWKSRRMTMVAACIWGAQQLGISWKDFYQRKLSAQQCSQLINYVAEWVLNERQKIDLTRATIHDAYILYSDCCDGVSDDQRALILKNDYRTRVRLKE